LQRGALRTPATSRTHVGAARPTAAGIFDQAEPITVGVVLRYGHLYDPGTGTNTAEAPALHVDAVAWAAVLAIEKARRGIYNIAEPSGYLSTEKAQRELGFDASVRLNAVA